MARRVSTGITAAVAAAVVVVGTVAVLAAVTADDGLDCDGRERANVTFYGAEARGGSADVAIEQSEVRTVFDVAPSGWRVLPTDSDVRTGLTRLDGVAAGGEQTVEYLLLRNGHSIARISVAKVKDGFAVLGWTSC